MRTLLFLVTLSALLLSACTTPPPVSGSISNKMGTLKVYPNGRFEIVVEPRTGK